MYEIALSWVSFQRLPFWFDPTHRVNALMCVRSVGPDGAPYMEVLRHVRPLTISMHNDEGNWVNPSSPWRNSVHSNDAADNGDSDNFVVVMVVESKNEVFSIPESLETIG